MRSTRASPPKALPCSPVEVYVKEVVDGISVITNVPLTLSSSPGFICVLTPSNTLNQT